MARVEWTYAALWESVAASLGDEPAIIQGDTVISWRDFSERADALARYLLDQGLEHQAKIAVYAMNCPEFLIAYFAAFKAGLVPYNVNYRYSAEEIGYLLENGDAEAVVFGAAFSQTADAARADCPGVSHWIAIEQPGIPVPDWATGFDAVTAETPETRPVVAPWGRSGTDIFMIYTGGTTGMPKGVMWQQENLIGKGNYGANILLGTGPMASPEEAGPRALSAPIRSRSVIGPPLMHGTGMLSAFAALSAGGTVILLPDGRFDAETLWDMVDRHRATRMSIVGQAFAQPMLEVLDANPGRWRLDSVMAIGSSGAMWSMENKQGLLRHMPQAMLMDSFSSSEALGLGSSITTVSSQVETARFELGETCAVFTEDGQRVEPGSGVRGKVAVGGHIPLGYYKDEKKTAETFPEIEGQRWSIPGDWAEVRADGSLLLLGRGSQCINTGGEKVFPEEVEEVLKRHASVRDAAVTGLPDERFGERIAALVELVPGADRPPTDELEAHVRAHLAAYKAPRHMLIVETVARAPNGKLDYKAVKARAMDAFSEGRT